MVYYSDSLSEKMYEIWSRDLNVSIVDGYKILEGSEDEIDKVKQYQKVLLFVTMRQATKDYITEIEKLGFNEDNIILFTTQAMESEVSLYAREKGIRINMLPLFQRSFEDFL
ncbi:MAG: hypothetical protein ACLFNO_03815 [Parcubacteria group bacterium]